ncbi:MAG: peptide chain release factor N(5)-glutamine methyltransferase [Rhizobiales bacterium]|nr:peptide chain release factor N(5)-glutamine methyltransferase [Hyphomicrobiales bacterium]
MPAETLISLLGWGRGRLGQEGIDTAALDARLLLQHVTGVKHETLIGEPQTEVADEKAADYCALIERRARHEPVSRIVGVREFYGRNFRLSPATLDPRPDTETLISAAVELLRGKPSSYILDLGTGTGAIPVTLLAELPGARAVATDISSEALQIALLNARENGVADRLEVVLASWFDGVEGSFDLIISNPPYLLTSKINSLDPEVRDWDPHRALDGGVDGLDCYRAIAVGAGDRLHPKGLVVLEIGEGQGGQVTEIFANKGFDLVTVHRDLAGHVRCLVFGKRKMGVGNGPDLGYIPTR